MKITKIKNNKGLLTKVFTKTEDGFTKESHAFLQRGEIFTIDIPFKELDDFFNQLESNEAIILGVSDKSEKIIAPARSLQAGEMARSKENFKFNNEQLLLFDIDEKMTPEEAIIALTKLDPQFSTVEMLIRHGTSSYVFDTEKQEYCTEGTSLHIYVPATNIEMLQTYIHCLRQKSWEIGLAKIKVSANGSLLERFVFDDSVFSPERLIFESGAICRNGLEQRRPDGYYREGGQLKLCELPFDADKARKNCEQAKKNKREEAKVVKERFTTDYTNKAKALGGTSQTAKVDIEKLLNGIISSNFILHDLRNRHFLAGTINEKMDEFKIQDPIAPDGSQKAIIYWNNGNPIIHSFKSGNFRVEIFDAGEMNRQERKALGYEYSSKGKLLPTLESLKVLLSEHNIVYEYDLLKKSPKLVHDTIDWDLPNPEQRSLQTIKDIAYRMDMPVSIVDTIEALANDKDYVINPMMEMVKNGHKMWSFSRKDWVSELVKVLQPVSDINYELVSKWLIQCVAAWDFDEVSPLNGPLSSYEGVLVLQGEQGVRKTTFFRKLLPYGMDNYFKEGAMLNPDNKDSVKQCTSYAITELGELEASFNKSDIGSLKAFLSNRHDEYRLPYARKEEKHRRSVSFCGTVNDQQFLRDRSGARRFWIIPVKGINMELMDTIPKDELWGQVFDMYIKGEPWHIETESETYAKLKEIHEQYESYSPAHDVLLHIDKSIQMDAEKQRLSASKMFQELGIRHTKSDVDALAQKLVDNGIIRYPDKTFRVPWLLYAHV